MKLAEYLIKTRMRPSEFAKLIGVTRMSIHRYITEDRVPEPHIISRIARVTRGNVTAGDFPPPKKSVTSLPVKASPEQDNRKPYPWERRNSYCFDEADRRLRRMMQQPREGDGLSPPLKHAILVLGERVETDLNKRHFRLDHRIVDAREIVRQANRVLVKKGQSPISYPGVNPIDN
ncbi:helix-turn-helix domain-containing protein [Cerasicoccus fimbriatus]|uniref:helix-turn-helix domain-containing protein n=1 Tax=Cerasicoccus fimbriatus TaxID=3014554 RepID=UPI0022B3BDF8|nr:helix-turn-helix transcriptional regulator [Cerasicoccus sp. TK19100]